MKSRLYLILSLLIIFCLSSCASKPAVETNDIHTEKKQNQKKLLFEDWKYKGFGQALPVWFEAAYKNDIEALRKQISVPENHKIEIVTAHGNNSDQANKSLLQKLLVKTDLFELYDSSWALLSEKEAAEKNNSYPYFAAAVILIDNKEE